MEYIWLASAGELTQQSTLFRFTYMIDTLRTMGWVDWLVSAKEWEDKTKLAGNVCAIYTPKDELHQVFTDRGELIKPMAMRLTGDISGIPALLAQCHLTAERLLDDDGFSVLRLIPAFDACIDSDLSEQFSTGCIVPEADVVAPLVRITKSNEPLQVDAGGF